MDTQEPMDYISPEELADVQDDRLCRQCGHETDPDGYCDICDPETW